MDILENKRGIRTAVKAKIQELDREYCCKADQAIFEYITGMPEYKQAKTIFCFVGTEGEINTMPVIEEAMANGKCVGAPVCTGPGLMEARRIRRTEDLMPGSFGLLEPGADAALILPEEIDLAVVPCLSCSHDGRRLGYGGGYYDRYLERTKALKVVICREWIMRQDIPMESHDKMMDVVVSESGIIRNHSRRIALPHKNT